MSYLHIRCGVELPNSNLAAANMEPTLLQHMCSTKMAARSHDNSSSAANFFQDFIVSINNNWSIVKKTGNLPFKKIIHCWALGYFFVEFTYTEFTGTPRTLASANISVIPMYEPVAMMPRVSVSNDFNT